MDENFNSFDVISIALELPGPCQVFVFFALVVFSAISILGPSASFSLLNAQC